MKTRIQIHLRWRTALVWLGLALALAAIVKLLGRLAGQWDLPQDDFLAYWAAGRLTISGANPYAVESMLAQQQAAGWPHPTTPYQFWYLPWGLVIFMPFGQLAYPLSRVIWLLFTLIIALGCSLWLWRLYGGANQQQWIALVIATTFTPLMFALAEGQVTPVMLLGLTGFLAALRSRRWVWAGSAATLLAVKPQLTYLFWIALALWAVDRKRWDLIAGAGATFLAAMAVVLGADKAVIQQYLEGLRHNLAAYPDHTLAIGRVLRLLSGPDIAWLQFLPAGLGALWLLIHWAKHRRAWDWFDELPLLMLVTLATAVSAWMHDLAVLLGAVLAVAPGLVRLRRTRLAVWVAGTYLALNAVAFALMPALRFEQLAFAPMPFIFLAGYLVLRTCLSATDHRKKEATDTAG